MSDARNMRWVMGLVFGAVFTVLGCARRESGKQPEPRVPVTVWKVVSGRITQRIEVTGEVRPMSVVQVASKVGGRLERLGVDDGRGGYVPLFEGVRVRRGDILAYIDLAVYAARLRQAEAAYALAEAQYRDAEREENRVRVLSEQGAAAQQMLDKATTAKEMAKAMFSQAEAAMVLARIEQDEARLKSPIDGIVTKKLVDEGNVISPGTPLAVLEDVREVKVVASVAERYLPQLVAGETRATLRVDSVPDGEIESVVSKVYPTLDAATRTAIIEIVLNNEDGRLRPGNFAKVALDLTEITDAVVVPLSAILWQGKEAFVYVVEDGRAKRRPVAVGVREGERGQITEGLRAGEVLVVGGMRGLKDGDAVAVEERSAQ